MLHTDNHVAEITPNDVVDYHWAAARYAMVHRRLADKCSCAWLGQRRWPPHADPPAARTGRDPALIAIRRAVGPRTHRTGRSAYRQSRGRLSSRPFRFGREHFSASCAPRRSTAGGIALPGRTAYGGFTITSPGRARTRTARPHSTAATAASGPTPRHHRSRLPAGALPRPRAARS